jgi:hypothetical protein
MEITLHDNSKLTFTWIRPGLLNVELYQAGTLRDGHGWLLKGSAILTGKEVDQFLDSLARAREDIAL